MSPRTFAAIDIGSSGGRVMAGRIEGNSISIDAVHRFANHVIEADGHLRWDLSLLHREVATGLTLLPEAESVGIDTWGVDYGLLDADGRLLSEPISYRDERFSKALDDVHAVLPSERLYEITGTQFLPFNTIYQLAAEQRGPYWSRTNRVVLIPDLLAYWLTGRLRSEVTNASTTGLLDIRTGNWSDEILETLGIRPDFLPPIENPGALRGRTAAGLPVVTVGSHDTASAVVAVPATTDRFAYISSGTWSLVGLELDRPVVTNEARRANFTNETGIDSRVRFLRNVGGLWLLQECLRAWPSNGLAELLAEASAVPAGGPTVDVDDPAFIAPGDMPRRIRAAAGSPTMTKPETIRCILDSLAASYTAALCQASRLADRAIDVVHVVGGGSQNELLCQLTADAVRLPVIAGPAEATAFGNILVQARTAGAAPRDLAALRALVAASTPLRRYEPS